MLKTRTGGPWKLCLERPKRLHDLRAMRGSGAAVGVTGQYLQNGKVEDLHPLMGKSSPSMGEDGEIKKVINCHIHHFFRM